MTQVLVDIESLQRWARTIETLSEFALLSGDSTQEQRQEMASIGLLMASLIRRKVNVTDDFGFGPVVHGMPVDAAGCSGAVR